MSKAISSSRVKASANRRKGVFHHCGFLFCLLIFSFFALGFQPAPPQPPAVSSWWLTLDLGQPREVSKVSILWHGSYGSTNYSIQGSVDNNTWTNIQTDLSSAGSTAKTHPLTGLYRYIRLDITKAQSAYPIIYEVKLYGKQGEPQPPPPPPPPAVTSWWLAFDLGDTFALGKISILWDAVYGSADYSVQGSTNNSAWTDLLIDQSSAGSTTKIHPLTGVYRYIRLNINKAAGAYPIIYEVKIYSVREVVSPVIKGVSPQAGAIFNENEDVNISAVINMNAHPAEYQVSIDGVIKQSWSPDSSYKWTAEPGKHEISIEVKNPKGNDSKQIEVFVYRNPVSPP